MLRARRSRMRWVNEAQDWPTHSKLYAVAVEERRGLRDALIVEQCAVEAAEVVEHGLTVATASYLCMAARDNGRGRVNRNFHLRLTPQANDILADLYAFELAG